MPPPTLASGLVCGVRVARLLGRCIGDITICSVLGLRRGSRRRPGRRSSRVHRRARIVYSSRAEDEASGSVAIVRGGVRLVVVWRFGWPCPPVRGLGQSVAGGVTSRLHLVHVRRTRPLIGWSGCFGSSRDHARPRGFHPSANKPGHRCARAGRRRGVAFRVRTTISSAGDSGVDRAAD